MSTNASDQHHGFDATHWSKIARAASDLSVVRRPALDELLKRYWPALVSYLVFRKRLDRESAEDLVQGFILERILERQLLKLADKEKGKFRTFLIKCLLNYAVDQFRRSNRELPVQFLDDLEIPDEQPIDAYDVPRARLVLAQSLARMYEECRERNNRHIWGVFAWRILVPAMTDRPPLDYESLVKRFDFESPEQATNALVTAKRHIKRVVCNLLEEFPDCDDLDAELESVHAILRSAGAFDEKLISEALPEFVDEMKSELALDLDQSPSDSWASVLEMSEDGPEAWTQSDLASIWEHQLAQPVVRLLEDRPESHRNVPSNSHDTDDGSTRTLRDVLFSEDPHFETLQALKKLGRNLLKQKNNRLPGQIAWAIYVASIAAALPRWRKEITDLSDQELCTNLEMASTCSWLDDTTRSLAATGIDYRSKSE